MQRQVSEAERRAVEQHRKSLCEQWGREVTWEDAWPDWHANHARRWREQHQACMLAKEREEILRHKWIESEKAQRDLGAEAALDWIRKYAAQWRTWYEEEQSHLEA